MQFGGRYRISATRAVVWAALNDTEKLRAAIPGCRRLDWTGPGTLEMELEVNLALAKPVFNADLSLGDVVPAERYTLAGRGRGLLGKAEGAARIVLQDAGEETDLAFTAVGGADNSIMKLGKTLIGRSAQRIIDHFFERFGDTFGAGVTPLPADDAVSPAAPAAPESR